MTDEKDLVLVRVTIDPVIKLWTNLAGGVSVEVRETMEYTCHINFWLAYTPEGEPSVAPTSNHAAELFTGAGNLAADLAESIAMRAFESLVKKMGGKEEKPKISSEPSLLVENTKSPDEPSW
mgnify:CR=1 FL=1